jgi:ribonuclease HII
VDEVGRGAYAGPIVAAAAAVSVHWVPASGLTDSKKLSPKKREAYFRQYQHDDTVVLGVGVIGPEVIDQKGIDWAQAEAQAIAIRETFWRLIYPPFVVVDGISPPNIGTPEVEKVLLLPKGDSLVPAISLASVVAKVTRDRIMVEYEGQFSGYGFAKSSGYGVAAHQEALLRLGPCPIHRRSFGPVMRSLHQQEAPGTPAPWEIPDDEG